MVLLDEVGLAEISKYNPLKVLHRLLEPEEKELPDVAVVGISNWALDAAKMNRAIHLSRPEPTLKDLEETGSSILEAQLESDSSNVVNEIALQGDQYCSIISLFCQPVSAGGGNWFMNIFIDVVILLTNRLKRRDAELFSTVLS